MRTIVLLGVVSALAFAAPALAAEITGASTTFINRAAGNDLAALT